MNDNPTLEAQPKNSSFLAPRPVLVLLGGGVALLLAAVGLWALLGGGAAPTPAVPAPVVQTLYYQGTDGAILALDAATGVTRTLVPRQAQTTRLLDVSPDGQTLALLQSSRLVTDTIVPPLVTYTVRIAARGEGLRAVPIVAADFRPENAGFVADNTLVVVGRAAPPRLAALYLYDVAGGTSRLLAGQVETYFVLPAQGLLLYSHTLQGPDTIQPLSKARVMELAALDASGALTPQPLATWALGESGWPVQVWPDPAHNVVYFTTLQNPPGANGQSYWNEVWNPLALMALPVRPLGTPRLVAPFSSGRLPPVVDISASGRYFLWQGPVPTALPDTPRNLGGAGAPWSLGELHWDNGSGPRLEAVAQPLDPVRGGFLPGSDQFLSQPSEAVAIVPTLPGSPRRGTIRIPPTPPPSVTQLLQVYDPASRRTVAVAVGNPLVAVPGGATLGGVQAVGDRLLAVGPATLAGGTPGAADNVLQLLLGLPAGGGWRFVALGPLTVTGENTPGRMLGLHAYGLTPDRSAVLFSATGFPLGANPLVAAPVTLLYRASLDGTRLQLLTATRADSPILARGK